MSTILITGCSSGFGLETARLFLDRNWTVIATMRTPREDILPRSDRLRVLPLDVTNAGSIEPDDYFYRAFRTGGSTNVFKYSNPELDTLLDKGRATLDKPARQAAYRDAQKILGCTGPAAHIAYPTLFSAVRSNLQGYDIYANRSLVSLGRASLR